MKIEENLTNEALVKRFNNQFELVRYAIIKARNAILSGRELQVKSETQNLSARVLIEIGLTADLYADGEVVCEKEFKEPPRIKNEPIYFDDDEDEDEKDSGHKKEEKEIVPKGRKKSSEGS